MKRKRDKVGVIGMVRRMRGYIYIYDHDHNTCHVHVYIYG